MIAVIIPFYRMREMKLREFKILTYGGSLQWEASVGTQLISDSGLLNFILLSKYLLADSMLKAFKSLPLVLSPGNSILLFLITERISLIEYSSTV